MSSNRLREASMLPIVRYGTLGPAFVLMHFFGGSQREWKHCAGTLAPKYQCIALDLPGFGHAAQLKGYSVKEMAIAVEETMKNLKLQDVVLVGHSMSGKLALVLAAQGITNLRGLVLIAPSPPSPEPIEEKNRKKMLAMRRNRQDAESYLDGITAKPLAGEARESAVEDFIRTSPDAWAAWLKSGSEADWSARVGIVDCPAIVITGESDRSLGASVQRTSTLPHLAHSQLEIIRKCGHLPTMEAAEPLSFLMSNFMGRLMQDGTAGSVEQRAPDE